MKTRWLFSADAGKPEFYVTGNTVYAHPDGWIYTPNGKPVYWIDGDWVFENPGGSRAFYFRD